MPQVARDVVGPCCQETYRQSVLPLPRLPEKRCFGFAVGMRLSDSDAYPILFMRNCFFLASLVTLTTAAESRRPDADGERELEPSLELIKNKKKKYVFCALGCVLVNDKYFAGDLQQTKDALEEAGIPFRKMQTFGDVRTILLEEGLITQEEAYPRSRSQPSAQPMIAG